MPTLQAYRVYLGRQEQPFNCPYCSQSVLPKQFEKHCKTHHALNSKLCCVWCQGRVSWPQKQKKTHANHLMTCMRQFFHPPVVEPHSAQVPVPFHLSPKDPKESLFHHTFDPPPGAYDSGRPLPEDPLPLLFQLDSLNKAVSCVRSYLRLRETTEWYHMMVRTIAFPAFMRALDGVRTFTLPFSCWCDGGKPTVASHRQHRHFLLVYKPPGHYEKWVKTIKPDKRPRNNFRCLYGKPIESAMHLVNVIGYLCKRDSYCAFEKKDTKKQKRFHHFHLFEELPKDYRLPLVLQWPGGLDELLHQEHHNFMRHELLQAPLFQVKGQWRIKIRDIPGIVLGTVLPVARDFEPCDEETDAFVHLLGGRKLYFKRNPELLDMDPEAWLQTQAAGGNQFYQAVGNDTWIPSRYHQTLLNVYKPYLNEIKDLADQNKDLVHRNRDLVDRNRDLAHRNRDLEVLLAEQERELEASQQRREATEQENKRLKEKICEMQELEIERLRSELAQVKRELAAFTTHFHSTE